VYTTPTASRPAAAVHIDVVGFDVSDDETEQLREIARVTGDETQAGSTNCSSCT
jgi:hypothetical protein